MSTGLAIASVTYILKDLLNNGLIDHDLSGVLDGNVNVTALPPDLIDTTANPQSHLNLFMYRVTPNTGWSNVGYPSFDSNGNRIDNPPLALDLHYLLSAYGAKEIHSEILLGYAMQLMHENPVLSRKSIRESLADPTNVPIGGLPDELSELSTSELAEQVEEIKIAPETLSTEEISKLWAAFQTKYRPTYAYIVTVILIESKKSTKRSLPVQKPLSYIVPFKQPLIEKIMSRENFDDENSESRKICPGDYLVIAGKRLWNDLVEVKIGDADIDQSDFDFINDEEIVFEIPDDLQAGVKSVQVIHKIQMGSPPEMHNKTESNASPFVLCPIIENTNVTNISGTGNEPRSADITSTINPGLNKTQKVRFYLNELIPASITREPNSYSFEGPSLATMEDPFPKDEITIHVEGIMAGDYLIRILVDGAESKLEFDVNTGKYDSPKVSI